MNSNKTCQCRSARCLHLIERVRVTDAQTHLSRCIRRFPENVTSAEAELARAVAACPDHGTYRAA